MGCGCNKGSLTVFCSQDGARPAPGERQAQRAKQSDDSLGSAQNLQPGATPAVSSDSGERYLDAAINSGGRRIDLTADIESSMMKAKSCPHFSMLSHSLLDRAQ
jgi:hypothetical protein